MAHSLGLCGDGISFQVAWLSLADDSDSESFLVVQCIAVSWPRVLRAVPESQVLRQARWDQLTGQEPAGHGRDGHQTACPMLGTKTVPEPKLGLLAARSEAA